MHLAPIGALIQKYIFIFYILHLRNYRLLFSTTERLIEVIDFLAFKGLR